MLSSFEAAEVFLGYQGRRRGRITAAFQDTPTWSPRAGLSKIVHG